MTIDLPPDLARAVADLMDGYFFDDPAAVVRAALPVLAAKLDHDARRADLRREIEYAVRLSEQGLSRPLTDAVMAEIAARGRELAAQRKPRAAS